VKCNDGGELIINLRGDEMNDYPDFDEVMKPVIEWINNNSNPHAVIVIDSNSAVLYSGEKSIVTDEFIKD
jgi:alkaline phosphatase